MSEEQQLTASIRRGHELRDVSSRGLFWFAIAVIVAAVVIHFVIAAVFLTFRPPRAQTFPAEKPVVNWDSVPPPHLDTAPERKQ